jgi:hypothetical protein
MARLLLLSATPEHEETEEKLAALADLQRRAVCDRFGVHSVTDDPDAADVILFVETYGAGWHFEHVRRHPLTRKYRENCFVFCANPFAIPFLPGIYTSINRRWASHRTISGFYLGLPRNEFTTYTQPTDDLPFLYSFMGSTKNAPVRARLPELVHPRGVVRDTSADYVRVLQRAMTPPERRDYHRRYAELTKTSKFVLCPRGVSVSTIRLFETMRMGRAPVVLSDGWVPPPGPAWERFIVRVPEKEWRIIPHLLEEREGEAVAMGELARQVWEDWFSDEAAFHRIAEWCLQLGASRRLPEAIARWPAYLQYLRPFYLRWTLGMRYRAARAALGHSSTAELTPAKPSAGG